MKSNFQGLKLVLCAFIAVLVGSCSKDNLNGSLEPTSAKSDIFQPDHFSIADQGEKIVISWHSNLFKDEKASYVIKIERTNIESVLGKEAGKLTLNRSMDFYGKKVLLSVLKKDGRSIKIDSLVYTNNYHKFFTSNNKFMAHRGLSSLYPENTAMAFEKAADSGFEYVECDVWLTKDKQWVVIHDETIDRTSDGIGKLSNYTLEELKNFNFGFPKNFGNKYTQKILSINEFVELCKAKNVKPLIELKQGASEQDYKNLLQIVNNKFSYDKYALHAFSPTVLKSLRVIDKEVILGLISSTIIPNNFVDLKELYPCFYNLNISQIKIDQPFNEKSNTDIFNLYSNGTFTSIWTVNDKKTSENLSRNNMFILTPILPQFSK